MSNLVCPIDCLHYIETKGTRNREECGLCTRNKHVELSDNYCKDHQPNNTIVPVEKSESIQVEMPKWWLAMESDAIWFMYDEKPDRDDENWLGAGHGLGEVKVTGYTGTWQDSLHQWNGTAWVKEN